MEPGAHEQRDKNERSAVSDKTRDRQAGPVPMPRADASIDARDKDKRDIQLDEEGEQEGDMWTEQDGGNDGPLGEVDERVRKFWEASKQRREVPAKLHARTHTHTHTHTHTIHLHATAPE